MRTRLAFLLLLVATFAHADYREFLQVPVDPSMATKLRHVADATLADYPKLKREDLAITVVDVTNPATIARGDVQGDVPFYPASVIKLFFMDDIFATHKERVPDVDRALREMISVSDNDATAYLVDVLSNAGAGPELQGRALRRFLDRRRAINKRFAKLGYDISAMAKPWSYGPYGRERQLLGQNRENRNRLTANFTTALLLWIVRRHAPSSDAQLALLARPLEPLRAEENQVKEFVGEALPPGSRLWSKAGWTSEVRHDTAYVELPNGRKLLITIFTRGIADDVTLIPSIAKKVLAELGQ
ncbi:MAG TPA: serine hydrolase [Thermoanaerobaculia bacterium]|nr:serine hydrolase [Thermoanaerobaculia bacterium]